MDSSPLTAPDSGCLGDLRVSADGNHRDSLEPHIVIDDGDQGSTAEAGSAPAKGITTATAKKTLQELIGSGCTKIVVPPHFDMKASALIVVLCVAIVAIIVLLVNGVYLLAKGEPRQTRGIGSIAEALLLLLAIIFTLWILKRESSLEAYELDKRLRAISNEIDGWTGTYADLRTPQLPTVTTYFALRDGIWRDVPTLLLVEGDLIALGYGENTPCSVALFTNSPSSQEDYVLARGQKFTPDAMRTWFPSEYAALGRRETQSDQRHPWHPESIGHKQMAGRVLFLVLETPLSSHLEQISIHHKHSSQSVLQNQIGIIVRLCVLRILPIVAMVSFTSNLVMFGVVDVGQKPYHRMAIEVVLSKTVYVIFPFACVVMWPVFWICARLFTNSCEVVLFDTLQRSKTDYEDMEDIDEFDVEALPPTKDVTVTIGAILSRMRWLWSNCDYRNLSRSSNLSETLGSVTVICSIDKEGTIAEPFCSPEQLVVPDKDDEYAILDFAEQQVGNERTAFIIDDGWEKYLPSLRPLGLNCCLSTSAHRSGKLRIDTTHCRQNHMRQHGKILPSQDTCNCKIGRAIGFESEDLAKFRKLKEASVFAPFHLATDSVSKNGIPCAASFTSTIFQTGDGPGMLQMTSDGNVDLVLSMCSDYFDGSSLQPLDDRVMSTYYSLYLNALQQDLQCLAFSYRPLALDARGIRWPGWSLPHSGSLPDKAAKQPASDEQGIFVSLWSMPEQATPPPTSLSALEASKRPLSPLTRSLSAILEEPEDEAIAEAEARAKEEEARAEVEIEAEERPSGQQTTNGTAAIHDGDGDEDGRGSATDLANNSHHQDIADDDGDDDDMISEQNSMKDLPRYLTEESRKAALHANAKGMHPTLFDDNAEFDYSQEALELFATQEGFLRDALAEQVFLGLVTFAYEPKTDVCDFIEDLSIAGIRFVYFSRSKGRQSKAFAERLGLETDWNTCILLSSATDDVRDGDGYVEDHDIKARLPRGIENIRPHLEEVDDIPLQISLFAECTPEATREMINIFQEYGDVACCIGSALRDSNALKFAVADLAVGIEPIPHFNRLILGSHQAHAAMAASAGGSANAALKSATAAGNDVANDGSISTSGALMTQYALGAALTCVPCPLFLQHDTSLYTLLQVIREARRLLNCMQQCTILLALSGLAIVVINLITTLCLLPPALNGYLMIWILWIAVPLLGLSLLFVPHDENIMSTMPVKNQAHLSDLPRFAIYAVIRMLPPVVLTVFVYITSLEKLLPNVAHLGKLSSVFGKSDWLALDHEQQWALVAAQVYAMVAFVFHCVCVSSTTMYRTKTWLEFVPFRNYVWVGCSAICMTLTLVFAALLLAFGDAQIYRVAWYTYFFGFAGPLILLPLQDLCKLHDKRRWTRLQKLAKLEFNTKLGLHSPL